MVLTTQGITPKRVTSGVAHLRCLAPGLWATQPRKKVAAMASRLRRCVRYDLPGNRNPDLPHREPVLNN